MSKSKLRALIKNKTFPIILEKDGDSLYVVECPLFSGCYSQGKTIDESLKNIREVISICLEEKYNQDIVSNYFPKEISFHTVTLQGGMKFPVLNSRIIIKTLIKAGYFIVRQKGSHIRLHHVRRKSITVPRHSIIGKGLLKKILRDSGMSLLDFKRLLK